MTYIKDDLHNTKLPTLVIEGKKRYREYPQIGFGDEGSIHKYNEKIAFKTFDFISDKGKLPRKFEKIEVLGQIQDEAACFPIGLVGYEDQKKEGYFYEYVHPLEKYKDFEQLQFLKDVRQLLGYIIQADEAVQRFHKMGFILGDIKGNNIMLNREGKVKFVDTDNWMYGEYGFDVDPGRAHYLKKTYHRDFSMQDNDRFVFAMMAIQYFVDGSVIRLHQSDDYFRIMIECMRVSPEVKEGLRQIFSDADHKPYIGPILTKMDPDQKILTKEDVYRLNRIF